jgi:hypothetical protein
MNVLSQREPARRMFTARLRRAAAHLTSNRDAGPMTDSQPRPRRTIEASVETALGQESDPARLPLGAGDGGYVLCEGWMHPDGGIDRAIAVARAAGKRIVVVADVWEPSERSFFTGTIEPLLGADAVFVGGLVAGITSAVRGTATGLLNGFLVWSLGTVLILVLSALGLGQAFGTLGNVVAQLNLLQGGVRVPGVDATQIAQTIRTGSLAAFFGLLLAALAAMLGGLLGGLGRAADRRRT